MSEFLKPVIRKICTYINNDNNISYSGTQYHYSEKQYIRNQLNLPSWLSNEWQNSHVLLEFSGNCIIISRVIKA